MLDMLPDFPAKRLGPDAEPFVWLLREMDEGRTGALLTVTAVHGGAPRPVGTHMAVVSGARFDGYLSGGCVEPAIALEVEAVIADRRGAMMRFGRGSPFIDIHFPCGGGIDVLAHVGLTPDLIEDALERMARRRAFTLGFARDTNRVALIEDVLPMGWDGATFRRPYLPATRVVLAGRGPELEAVARLAASARYDVVVATPDQDTLRRLADLPIDAFLLDDPWQVPRIPYDPWTATVMLFHEREWEDALLSQALSADGFYIGALGSVRTHAQRRERLMALGHGASEVDRIRGPIGLIPSARDPQTLALSVLAEIAMMRRAFDERRESAIDGRAA
jgi:xanthine dehydrogenase accessory factor